MVYVAFSEFFFDSAMESYFQAGALQLSLVGDKVCQACLWGGQEEACHGVPAEPALLLTPLARCLTIWTCC